MNQVKVCLLFVIVVAVSAGPISSDERSFRENMAKYREFKCGPPQPRAFSTKDIFGKSLPANKVLSPPYVVLNRCDSYSGCCTKISRCGPSRRNGIENKTLVFQSLDMVNFQEKSYEKITVENHVKCECLSIEGDMPK